MASRTDVIMAGYKKDLALEELSKKEKVEGDKWIRAMDTTTAAAEGAKMGIKAAEAVPQAIEGTKKFVDGVQYTKDKFAQRAKIKSDFIDKYGRKAWRKGGIDEQGNQFMAGREMRKMAFADDQITDDDLISMYIEGTNDYKMDSNGNVTSHAEDGDNVNVSDFSSIRNMFKTASVSGDIPGMVGAAFNYAVEDIKDAPRQLKQFGKDAWDAVRNDPADPDDWYFTKHLRGMQEQTHRFGEGGMLGLMKYGWQKYRDHKANKDFEEIIKDEETNRKK